MVRGIAGVLFSLIGAVWIAQGTGALKGSFMTGEGQWTVIGIVTAAIGVALLGWAWHDRSGMRGTS
jgi:hypothetical protein